MGILSSEIFVVGNPTRKYGEIEFEMNSTWKGPALCAVGKLFFVYATVYSKKWILIRGFIYKIKEYNMNKLDRDFEKVYNKDANSHLKPRKSPFYQDYFEGFVKKIFKNKYNNNNNLFL